VQVPPTALRKLLSAPPTDDREAESPVGAVPNISLFFALRLAKARFAALPRLCILKEPRLLPSGRDRAVQRPVECSASARSASSISCRSAAAAAARSGSAANLLEVSGPSLEVLLPALLLAVSERGDARLPILSVELRDALDFRETSRGAIPFGVFCCGEAIEGRCSGRGSGRELIMPDLDAAP
tara:strand:- start:1071 stop:1622 length:552 start_codon:yes stop_codon:yes gene_type:complete